MAITDTRILPYKKDPNSPDGMDPAQTVQDFLAGGQSQMQSPNDPIKLLMARSQQADDMSRQQDLAKQYPKTYVAGSTPSELATVKSDMANDPYTGDLEQERLKKQQDASDLVNQFMNPGQQDMASQIEARKAREASVVPNIQAQSAQTVEGMKGRSALDVENARGKSNLDVEGLRAKAVVDAANAKANVSNAKLSPAESSTMDMINTHRILAPQVLSMYEQENPGIESNPEKFGSPTDMMGAAVGGALYRAGHVSTPADEHLQQYTGFIEATLPRLLASGRLNRQQYDDLKLHVPQVGLSPGANYLRIKYVQNLLDAVEQGIHETHGGSTDVITDPNWGK